VNNAGAMWHGLHAGIEAEALDRMLQLNIVTLNGLTRRLLPGMIARGWGRILNVASVSAFLPIPGLAAYAASKAFVLSLSESLAEETRGTGIHVCALCPGVTETAMYHGAKASGTRAVTALPS